MHPGPQLLQYVIAVQQFQVVEASQQGQHQFVYALATIRHGLGRWQGAVGIMASSGRPTSGAASTGGCHRYGRLRGGVPFPCSAGSACFG
jgi:hypothetical protein